AGAVLALVVHPHSHAGNLGDTVQQGDDGDVAAKEIRDAAALGVAGVLRLAEGTPVPAGEVGRHLADLLELFRPAVTANVPLAVAVPLTPVEAVPAEALLRGGLEALVVFGAVVPL